MGITIWVGIGNMLKVEGIVMGLGKWWLCMGPTVSGGYEDLGSVDGGEHVHRNSCMLEMNEEEFVGE